MTSVTEEMIEAAQARLTDDRLQEILAATQGVTRGPWQVYTKEHPWALPEREFLGGKFPASTGTHKERFVITTWVHPQVKAEPTVIGGSVGVGVDGPVHMVHIEEADAAHIANCDPQTIAALVTELQSARAALEAALSASPAAQAEVVEQAEGWESALHGAMISRIMPETSSDMTFAEAEALGADLLGLIRTYAPSAPQPTEPVAVKLDRDALAELLSRAGAPPGPPDGPIRALPENHFERVRAYKQADAVLSALASPVAQQRDEVRSAALIEAAPDMLAALIEVQADLVLDPQIQELVEAAIEKAEGRS